MKREAVMRKLADGVIHPDCPNKKKVNSLSVWSS